MRRSLVLPLALMALSACQPLVSGLQPIGPIDTSASPASGQAAGPAVAAHVTKGAALPGVATVPSSGDTTAPPSGDTTPSPASDDTPAPDAEPTQEAGETTGVPQDGEAYDALLKEATERHERDEALVKEFVTTYPDLANDLTEAPEVDGDQIQQLPDGNYLVKLENAPEGLDTVVTLGTGAGTAALAAALRNFPTSANQHALYEALFERLPEEERGAAIATAELPEGEGAPFATPRSLIKRPIADLLAWNERLARRLIETYPVRVPEVLVKPERYVDDPTQEVGAGTGLDVGPCRNPHSPNGIYANFNWNNKYYTTSVKSQGPMRGTCAAFAITSAQEMVHARKYQTWVNFSEQDFFYRNKAEWWPPVSYDDLDLSMSFDAAADRRYGIPVENAWEYNRSPSRVFDPTTGLPKGSCDGYTGPCSDTIHQGPLTCVDGRCVARSGVANYLQPYTMEGQARQIWHPAHKDFGVAMAIATLQEGFPVCMSIRTARSFRTVGRDGFVSLPSAREVVGGNHAVHVTGYLSNERLASRLPKAPPGAGGGYFIVKNSWGACFGDGGYVYLPVDWVKVNAIQVVILQGRVF